MISYLYIYMFFSRQDKSLLKDQNTQYSHLIQRLNKVWGNCKELQRICAFHGYCSDPLDAIKMKEWWVLETMNNPPDTGWNLLNKEYKDSQDMVWNLRFNRKPHNEK
uniref:Uncharacterized protein n=1 Tax=Cacopsylla melanoneura TaxID=428564 RepID=A0A8D9AH52_9HEMI